MLHGPCGNLNPTSVCMQNDQNVCSKRYPKEFCAATIEDVEGYPKYRRRNNGQKFEKRFGNRNQRFCFDNRDVVPYNPYLILKYNAHINVEICSSIRAVKYLYKYVYKGHDRANVRIENEIDLFMDCRYLSAPEACWRLFQFDMHDKSHTVMRMQIHLPNEQTVYFEPGHEEVAINRAHPSMLMQWFVLNQSDPEARRLLYTDVG